MKPDSPPLRVGYVLKRFPRFSETFILNEILELERQGVEVEVFSLMRPPEEQRHAMLAELRSPVTYLGGAAMTDRCRVSSGIDGTGKAALAEQLPDGAPPFGPVFSGKSPRESVHLSLQAAQVALLVEARGIRHLHAHFGSNAASVALLASRLSRRTFSYTAHARDIYHTYVDPAADDAMRAAKMREAAFVATVSEYNRAHLAGLLKVPERGRVRRLYNGIDLERFALADANPQRFFGGRLLAVGRLVEKKGFADLVAAAGMLARSGLSFSVDIVGEGPLQGALADAIRGSGLERQVRLLGARPQHELVGMLAEASAVVLPCVVTSSGDRDGLPTVLLEAMAAGLPVVSTRVAGVPEIIEAGETGLLVDPGNPRQLADALHWLLRNPARASAMGAAGRRRARSLFDLKQNVATLVGWFRDAACLSAEDADGANRIHHG